MNSNMSDQTIEVDPVTLEDDYDDDGGSGYTGSGSTMTLMSAAKVYVYENGRRFHGWREGRYAMPNDEEEQDRMDLQHHICLLALSGELYVAPAMKDPKRILDLGTGTGIWAIDIGDSYPDAQVIGVDLSPIQPEWVPPNVSFEVDDIEQLWLYADNSFDFVHIRQLTGFINDWPRLYAQALRVLKPGGYFEAQEFVGFGCDDSSVPADGYMFRWFDLWAEGIKRAGKQLPDSHADGLVSAGFANVVYRRIKIPIGLWAKEESGKEIGLYMRQHFIEGGESIALAVLTRFLGWSKEEVDMLLVSFRRDLMIGRYHGYTRFHCTYGQKPEKEKVVEGVNEGGKGEEEKEQKKKEQKEEEKKEQKEEKKEQEEEEEEVKEEKIG